MEKRGEGREKEKFAKIIWRLTPSPYPPPPPYGENRDEKKPILALHPSSQPSHNGSGSGFALSFAIVVAELLHLDSRKVAGRKDAADCACTPCKLCTLLYVRTYTDDRPDDNIFCRRR